jgi:hypothetical protein
MKKRFSIIPLILVILSLLLNCACGGGGTGMDTLPTFNPGSVSKAERNAAYDEVETLFHSIYGQKDAAAQLVAKMKTMSQFAAAEISESGDAIGWFKDGQMYAVFTSDQYTPTTNVMTSAKHTVPKASGRDLTGEPTAYLINAFEPAREDATLAIAGQLNDKLYNTIVRTGTVNDYISIRDAGLLFIHAHGIIHTDKTRKKHFWYATSDTPNDAQDLALKSYIDSGQLSVGSGPAYDSQGSRTTVRKYIITDKFLHDVGTTFAKNATWISQSCSSFNPFMLRSVLDPETGFPGVETYGGWTKPEDSTESTPSMAFLFDRLLGTNSVQPIQPGKPNPLTISEAFAKLITTTRPGGGLVYGSSNTVFGLSKFAIATGKTVVPTIIPAINEVSVNIADQVLEISGHFGSAQGPVTLDGSNLTVTSWSETLVKVTKPDSNHGTLVLRSLGGASPSGQLRSNSFEWVGLGVALTPSGATLAKLATQSFTVSATTGTIPSGSKYRWTVIGTGKVNGAATVTTASPTVTYKAPNQDTSDNLKVEVVSTSNAVIATSTAGIAVGQSQITFNVAAGMSWPELVGSHSFNDGSGYVYSANGNDDYQMFYDNDANQDSRVYLDIVVPVGTTLSAGQVVPQ